MANDVLIPVATLDPPQRRALEGVIGRTLDAGQKLVIRVLDEDVPLSAETRQPQSLDDWTSVYDGLDDAEIEAIDAIVKSRADLSRGLPE